MTIRPFQSSDEPAVIALWQRCNLVRPWNDPHKDIQRKLAVNPELFLVGLDGNDLIATIMIGYEGHRGWINYLAVDPDHQRRGHAQQLMAEAEKILLRRGCPKINLQVRTINKDVIEFYNRIGYSIDEVVSFGKRLQQD